MVVEVGRPHDFLDRLCATILGQFGTKLFFEFAGRFGLADERYQTSATRGDAVPNVFDEGRLGDKLALFVVERFGGALHNNSHSESHPDGLLDLLGFTEAVFEAHIGDI